MHWCLVSLIGQSLLGGLTCILERYLESFSYFLAEELYISLMELVRIDITSRLSKIEFQTRRLGWSDACDESVAHQGSLYLMHLQLDNSPLHPAQKIAHVPTSGCRGVVPKSYVDNHPDHTDYTCRRCMPSSRPRVSGIVVIERSEGSPRLLELQTTLFNVVSKPKFDDIPRALYSRTGGKAREHTHPAAWDESGWERLWVCNPRLRR